MIGKSAKKRRSRVYPAPPKRRASYFFTSFFLTLALIISAAGFLIADRNSQRLGWGRDIEVFAVTNSEKQINVTFMGKQIDFDTALFQNSEIALDKVKLVWLNVQPESLQFAEMLAKRLALFEQEFLSRYNFLSKP